uniref:Gustatory receptor n=1 Tax=Tetranychus urticae TaxID=32264 RepID=T1KM56_TETUR
MSNLKVEKLKPRVSSQHNIFLTSTRTPIDAKVEINWFLIQFFTNCSLKSKILWNSTLITLIVIPVIIALSKQKFSFETNLDRILTLNASSEYLFLFYITLFHQWTFRKSVVDQINQLWSNINLTANQHLKHRLLRERSTFVILALAFISFGLLSKITSEEYQFVDWISILKSVFSLANRLAFGIFYCFLHLQFLMEMVILITAAFDHVNHLIELQVENGPTLNEIKSIRRLYSDIVQLTDYFAESLKIFVTMIYLKTTYLIVSLSYTTFVSGYTVSKTYWMALAYFTGPIIILILTFRIIKVNISAYSSFDDLYSLTQCATTKEMKFELLMFIHRVARNDVGLKFCKSTLIGPNFFSTLLTICIASFFVGIALILQSN